MAPSLPQHGGAFLPTTIQPIESLMANKREQEPSPTMVTVKPSWGSGFRRFMRDESGKVTKELSFEMGVAKIVTDEEVDLLMNDIGNSLAICTLNEHAQVKIDWEGTQAVADLVREKNGETVERDPDPVAVLTAAGLGKKIANLLVENANAIPEPRLLSPDGLLAWIAAGNSLDKDLEGFGEALEKQVLDWVAATKKAAEEKAATGS